MHRLIPRILITILGAVMILVGFNNIALEFFGEETSAVITSVRRVGGERNEAVPNRYTYSIGYEFTLPDGRKISGSTERIGDSVYLKPGKSSFTRVRYYSFLPFINTLESETGLNLGSILQIFFGGLLCILVNRRGQNEKADKKSG